MLTFSPSLFFQQATCPHWIWRDLYGDPKRKGELPELAKKLLEQGVLHEEEYIKGLSIAPVSLELGEVAYVVTEQLMLRGVPLIYQGAIRADFGDIHYTGRPDLLERIEQPSKFGGYLYRPVDIKNSKDVKQLHWLQLTLYGLILEKMQGVFPEDVAIINSEKTRLPYHLTLTHRLKTNNKINEIARVMRGHKPPLKLVSSCKNSPWFSECVRESEAVNDIALIYRLDNRAATTFRSLGLTTVKQIAEMDPAKLPRIPYMSATALERVKLQAQALQTHELRWLAKPSVPTAPIQIYFDIEGDPLLQVQYLFGFWIVGDTERRLEKFGQVHTQPDSSSYYLYFLAKEPADEAVMWKQFICWLRSLPASNQYLVYHFADYERSRTKGMAETYGHSNVVEPFIDRFVDLSIVVQQSVIMPLYFYSIKDIAKSKFLGYKWRHPKAGGAQSIFWYEKWLETKDPQVLLDIVNYNEDDVVATEYLRNWLLQAN